MTKSSSHAARRAAFIFLSTILVVSAQAAEPYGGIRYSDFLKHGGADVYGPLVVGGGKDFDVKISLNDDDDDDGLLWLTSISMVAIMMGLSKSNVGDTVGKIESPVAVEISDSTETTTETTISKTPEPALAPAPTPNPEPELPVIPVTPPTPDLIPETTETTEPPTPNPEPELPVIPVTPPTPDLIPETTETTEPPPTPEPPVIPVTPVIPVIPVTPDPPNPDSPTPPELTCADPKPTFNLANKGINAHPANALPSALYSSKITKREGNSYRIVGEFTLNADPININDAVGVVYARHSQRRNPENKKKFFASVDTINIVNYYHDGIFINPDASSSFPSSTRRTRTYKVRIDDGIIGDVRTADDSIIRNARAGDVIKLRHYKDRNRIGTIRDSNLNLDPNSFAPGKDRVYRIIKHSLSGPSPRLYFAEGEFYAGRYVTGKGKVDGGVRECTPSRGRFFLDNNYVATQNRADAREAFELRNDWRGLIGGQAIRIGSFNFAQSDNLRNLHVEYQATPFVAGAFTLYTNSGLRRFDSGTSTMTYTQSTASWKLAPSMQLYAQGTGGLLRSTKYANGRLRSYTFGMFADAVGGRHDNYFHVRVEAPLADSRATSWRAAADMVIGKEAHYIRFGLNHQLDGQASGAHVFYTREF